MASARDERGRQVVARLLDMLGLPATLLSPLEAHAAAVARDSPRLGLVSSGDESAVLTRHSADSLVFALARTPLAGESWADVGSGGGFPGLVLAICYPECRFMLLEPNAKKAGFLELQALDLGLANVSVSLHRAGEAADVFDVAVSRAMAEPSEAIATLSRLLRPTGTCLVAGTGETPAGATRLTFELPFVDSPATLFKMTRADDDE